MIYLIDGSNLLGRSTAERESAEAKRALVRALGAFARRRKLRVACFFDGPRPPSIGASPGGVTVAFSAPRSADDMIQARAAQAKEPMRVVTSDQTLAARVKSRRVEIVDTRSFIAELAVEDSERSVSDAEDWESYFSDPENRNI